MAPVRVPSIVLTEFNTEWFKSIKHKLYWNAQLLDRPTALPKDNSLLSPSKSRS